jgi:two-component system, NarL family, response regulator NreC
MHPEILRRPPMPIRILLAEDHVIVRQGLRALLEQAGMTVIGEASDGQEALRIAHEQHPDVAILDIAMPHLNGLETARRLREALPQTKIVLLTMHTEDPYVLEAMQAGAVGYVLKTQAAADIVQAIRDVVHGEIYLSSRVSRAVVKAYLTRSDLPTDPLTSREREILQLISEGQTTKEIAWRLGLSAKTVESHRIRLMRKLDIHETATLVRYAIRRGLTHP